MRVESFRYAVDLIGLLAVLVDAIEYATRVQIAVHSLATWWEPAGNHDAYCSSNVHQQK